MINKKKQDENQYFNIEVIGYEKLSKGDPGCFYLGLGRPKLV